MDKPQELGRLDMLHRTMVRPNQPDLPELWSRFVGGICFQTFHS